MKTGSYIVICLACAAALVWLSCSGGGSGSGGAVCPTPVTQQKYLMAFHHCDGSKANCGDPKNHTIRLAGSDDGISFSLVDAFTPRTGSVPDLVTHNGSLYLFHTGGSERWAKLDTCLNIASSGGLSIDGVADSFVDPSVLSIGGKLVMYYLPGTLGADPAGCGQYPCVKEIRSASSDGADPSSMKSVSGPRVSLSVTAGTFSDPDIVSVNGGGYLLYVSAGQSVYVFTGTDVNGSFSSPGGAPYYISNGQGGVPSAIQADDGSVWLYVTTNTGGRESIRWAVSADGVTPLGQGDFSTVIDSAAFTGFASTTSFSSPSIIRWKGMVN